MATGNFRELPDFTGDNSRYFDPNSVDPGTLGTEVFKGDFSVDVDGNLTAFDNTPVVQRTDTPNEVSKPEPEQATTVQKVGAAHYAVWKNLNYITFVPGSACQMSQAIAYIRYWSKEGVQKKTEVETQEQSTAPTDPQEEVSKELEEKYSDTSETTNNENQQQKTRTVLTVPDNSAYQSRPRQPVPTSVPVTKSQPEPKAGKIVSANPSGIRIMNPVSGVVSSPNITDAVWMFLLNPEELQLSSGPDYNRAETWGVSDPKGKNDGQPLSWRSNRNRKLSFGKVLLHGYTFGKRVDTLEAGLQQLFMAREGEGSDGPPVLEFVWGKRFFGPCVIQNIQVREKAWDKGILVNAEVSFELEQVPEWTINDGEVDVLRPGRQPTVNDPVLPQRSYDDSNKGSEEKPTPEPKSNDPAPRQPREKDLRSTKIVCDGAEDLSKKFDQLSEKASKFRSNLVGTKAYVRSLTRQIVNGYILEYSRLVDQLKNKVPGSSKLNKLYEPGQVAEQIDEYFKGNPNDISLAKGKSITFIQKVCKEAGGIAKSYYTSETCRRIPGELQKIEEVKRNKNERQYQCSSIKENSPCTIGPGEVRANPCNNKNYRCTVKDRNPGITVYREIK